jgi:hypothetical protein
LVVGVHGVASKSVSPEQGGVHAAHTRLVVALQAVVSYCVEEQVVHDVHTRLLASLQAVVSYAPTEQVKHGVQPDVTTPPMSQTFDPEPVRASMYRWLVCDGAWWRDSLWRCCGAARCAGVGCLALGQGTRATSDVLAALYVPARQAAQPVVQPVSQESCPAGRDAEESHAQLL